MSGKHRLVALQLEYSLVERNIEREHVPLAQELGFGICPWSPLARGFLTGKYRREDVSNTGRLSKTTGGGNPVFERFNDRNWKIVDTLVEVAKELGRSPAEVALHWAVTQPGITPSSSARRKSSNSKATSPRSISSSPANSARNSTTPPRSHRPSLHVLPPTLRGPNQRRRRSPQMARLIRSRRRKTADA